MHFQWFRPQAPARTDTHTQRRHTHCHTQPFKHQPRMHRWTGPTYPAHTTVLLTPVSLSYLRLIKKIWHQIWHLCCVLLRPSDALLRSKNSLSLCLRGISSRVWPRRGRTFSYPPPNGGRRNDGGGPAGAQHYHGLDGRLREQYRGQPSDSPRIADLREDDSDGKPDLGNTRRACCPVCTPVSHGTFSRLSRSSWSIRVWFLVSVTVYSSFRGGEGVTHVGRGLIRRPSRWWRSTPFTPQPFEHV